MLVCGVYIHHVMTFCVKKKKRYGENAREKNRIHLFIYPFHLELLSAKKEYKSDSTNEKCHRNVYIVVNILNHCHR